MPSCVVFRAVMETDTATLDDAKRVCLKLIPMDDVIPGTRTSSQCIG